MKNVKKTNRFPGAGIAALLLICSGFLTGCGKEKSEQVTAQKSTTQVTQKQVQDIQNNPRMPPAAKEAALRSLQQGQAAGAGMRASAQGGQAK